MSYSDEIIEKVKAKNPNEPEFIQAVTEVMNSLRLVVDNDPKYQNEALLERIVEPQLAKTMEYAVVNKVHGLYNMVPDQNISKYDLLCLLNKYVRRNPIVINPKEGFVADKTLIRTKFDGFDYRIPSYEVMVEELGNWMRRHKELYPQYEL